MKNDLKQNNACVIGLPSCNYVFSASKMCFIAYGFKDSPMEVDILEEILKKRNVEPFQADGNISSGEYAFCKKICSKIINSQFCIVILNNSIRDGREVPNANVNMEYGLMLGFGKKVIPFQLENQKLPFNVAGLDTIKYSIQNFKTKAETAIDFIIKEIEPDILKTQPIDDILEEYFLERGWLFSALNTQDEKQLYELGSSVGFNLLSNFRGNEVIYLGIFSHFKKDLVIKKTNILCRILEERFSFFEDKIRLGLIPPEQVEAAFFLRENTKIVVITAENDADAVSRSLPKTAIRDRVEVIGIDFIHKALSSK